MTDERRLPVLRAIEAIVENELSGVPAWRYELADRLTDAALAALPQPATEPALDVERLARAMARIAEVGPPAHVNPDDAEEHWSSYLDEATDYAAEYARLAAQPLPPSLEKLP